MYFVLYISEDGDFSVDQLDKDLLLDRINDKYYGDVEFNDIITDRDPNCWKKPILIIKGDIVTPTPITFVARYKL